MKRWFRKVRLTSSAHLRMIVVQFVGSSPWGGIVPRLEALVFCCNDLTVDSSWTEMWSLDLLNTYSVRDRNLYILDWIHAKGGDKNLCILGGLSTIDRWGWQTSISICLWLVGNWSHFQESYWDNHLIGRSSDVLIWFPYIEIIYIPPYCVIIWN